MSDSLLEKENLDLKEIIETAFQITAHLDVESIVKTVALSLYAKFQTHPFTFILPGGVDEEAISVFTYRGIKKDEVPVSLPSLAPLLAYLDKDEYSQVPFASFAEAFSDKAVVEAFRSLSVEVIVPLRTDKGVFGVALLPRHRESRAYDLQEIETIARIMRFAAIAIENAYLFHQATTDRMTGLFSHHSFEKELEDEMKRARRYGSQFSLVMFDIDHFKKFNDSYGHVQGDRIIREIAKIATRSIRQVDYPARYGGEEFTVILPSVDIEGASVVAERLRTRVEEHPFPSSTQGHPLHVTISVGIAEFDPERDITILDMVGDSDKALYLSKQAGRNRVTACPHCRKA
jgi:two-component system cell cycle response regulator